MDLISNKVINGDDQNDESLIIQNECINGDEFQQLQNQDDDVMQGQSEEKVYEERNKTNQNDSVPQQCQQNDSEKKEETNSQSKKQKLCNERKMNTLYFIGVNSILINILQIRLTQSMNQNIIQIAIILFTNLVTYTILYKSQQTKNVLNHIISLSKNAAINLRNAVTKKRVIYALRITVAILIITLTLVCFVRINQLQREIRYLEQDFRTYQNIMSQNNNDMYNHSHQSFSEFIQTKNHLHSLQQLTQIQINNLDSKINKLEHTISLQNNQISNQNLQLHDHIDQFQKNQLLQQQQHQQLQQQYLILQQQQKQQQQNYQQQQQDKFQENLQQNSNNGKYDKPEYPKIHHPIRDDVHPKHRQSN